MSKLNSNKKIAKNTLMLYIRMFLSMGVSLYTSRIVLNTLGVSDFGIYNVVGGVVMMFSFLNSSMSSATQRFLSFEMGKNDYEQLKKVFSMSVNIHAIVAISVFILAETIGLWFLNSKLNIPPERLEAANWVFHFSVLSFMLTVFSVPYNASIIAHERMNVYAYVSIVEVILKLTIVFILVWFGYDKLKLYAVLVFFVSLIVWSLYKIYCKRNFTETNYKYFWEQSLYKTLMSYAGWNLFGNVAGVAMGQGVNILLNLFFGPIVNAARGIAYQVNGAINGFVSNFQMAMNPQIVKSYAANDRVYMHQLIFQGSKYSFFLLLFISLPVFLEAETVLHWWLKVVPEYSVLFFRLVLINTLIDCISGPLMTAALASGKIKRYQSVVGGLLLLILPVSYLLLELGMRPQITMYVSISVSIIALFLRLLMLRPLIQISISKFLMEVVFKVLIVLVFALLLPVIIRLKMPQGIGRFFTVSIMAVTCTTASIYICGLSNFERHFLKSRIAPIINKILKYRK